MSFFREKQLLWYLELSYFVCICQNPFALMCPLRKAENKFRVIFEQMFFFWCSGSLEEQFEDLTLAKHGLRMVLEV